MRLTSIPSLMIVTAVPPFLDLQATLGEFNSALLRSDLHVNCLAEEKVIKGRDRTSRDGAPFLYFSLL